MKTQTIAKERLKCAALIRNGVLIERGFRSHYLLRGALGDKNPQDSVPGDIEGFVTSTGRFVDREEGRVVALASGQIGHMWEKAGRKLLSADIDW